MFAFCEINELLLGSKVSYNALASFFNELSSTMNTLHLQYVGENLADSKKQMAVIYSMSHGKHREQTSANNS